jgi:glycogen operon protein
MASGFSLGPGRPYPPGVTVDAAGANVAVFSAHAMRIDLCLFDDGDRETARMTLPERTGDVFHGHVAGLRHGMRYGLRAHGPHAPREGHRFNAHKLLLDPNAALIDRPFVLHPSMFGYRQGHPDADLSFDDADSAPFMPKAVIMAPAAPPMPAAPVPWNRSVIYEMHVRGFTMLHPKVPKASRGTFAGLGHPAALKHLADLGISSVELLPVAAWLDERHLGPLGLGNYWGYNPAAFGAPDPRLAPGGWDEIAATTEKLEAAGIETLLDVVLNHTGEGDELGPTVSLRGLDNASYYRLDPHDPRRYANDAGCGNTLALERPAVLHLAMDSLRRFAERGGVHGFRFDLATTLGRRAGGFDADHPLLAAITQDPVLGRLKLIAEPWDIGMGGYQLGRFPAGWGEWNDRYRDTARRFWRGDAGMTGEMATRFAGSADIFAARRRPVSRSINFITAHDGFTLADLVSHTAKHNEENGEDNRDGTDANLSWNHGAEGPSGDPAINAARAADQRALLATLLLSRGTPMLAMGDEIGRCQGGNNNAYAQDNTVSWLDWAKADMDLATHAAALIRLRLATPALHADAPLTGHPIDTSGLPDVSWLRPDGQPMQQQDWSSPDKSLLIAMLHTSDGNTPSSAIVILHSGHEPVDISLPEPRPGHGWALSLSDAVASETLRITPRSVVCLTEIAATGPRRRSATDPALLAKLAAAAGIAPDWWEVSGRHHAVTPDVQRAMLAAMRLPAASSGEARESLAALVTLRDERALPLTVVSTEALPARVALPVSHGLQIMLRLEGEDGTVERLPVAPSDGDIHERTGLDGRPRQSRHVALPPLPAGRYQLLIEDQPDAACALLVAPRACWLPEGLERRPFGIAAHLYGLRRDGDQGIGDFTTLAAFGRMAAERGAATLGLNPLHAQFGHDRERASPYHPSDRRFLDPIYLDLASGPFATVPAVRIALARHEALFAACAARTVVDYPAVWRAKREVLAAAFSAMQHAAGSAFAALQDAFSAFIAAGGDDLANFAAFEAISAHQRGKPWQQWPQALRDAEPAAIASFAAGQRAEIRFAQFQQWLSEQALGEAAADTGLAIGLYRDLAVGSAPDGAEAWDCQHRLARGVSIGAPPDPFAADGQVWNLPAPDPLATERDGYRGFGRLLASNMRHAGALRIDHAMGLQRLFWVPDGASATEGAYVSSNRDAHLAVLALESQRAHCMVIGEDLGTVPDGFRAAMDERKILSYRVLWLEREGQDFNPPSRYPAMAASCIGTHDLPTLAGWWQGSDLAEILALGLLPAHLEAELRGERAAEKAALLSAMTRSGFATADAADLTPGMMAEIHRFLSASPSVLMLVQADDLTGDATRMNLPGTDRERANWRRVLAPEIGSLLASPLAKAILAAVRGQRG